MPILGLLSMFSSLSLSKQSGLHQVAFVKISAQMFVGQMGGHAPSWRSFDESFHDKERLVHLFHRARIFANGGRNGA